MTAIMLQISSEASFYLRPLIGAQGFLYRIVEVNMHGTYIGADKTLHGKTAIARLNPAKELEVQFDDMKALSREYTHAWLPIKNSEFKFDDEGEFA